MRFFGWLRRRSGEPCVCNGTGRVKVSDSCEDGSKSWSWEACPARRHNGALARQFGAWPQAAVSNGASSQAAHGLQSQCEETKRNG
jgi:hypothetical protein